MCIENPTVRSWLAIASPLEKLLPLMDGALHFTPSALVHTKTDKLNEHGRRFAHFMFEVLLEAFEEATKVCYDDPHSPLYSVAGSVRDTLEPTLLLAQALMAEETIPDVSHHTILERIQADVRAAHAALQEFRATLPPIGRARVEVEVAVPSAGGA